MHRFGGTRLVGSLVRRLLTEVHFAQAGLDTSLMPRQGDAHLLQLIGGEAAALRERRKAGTLKGLGVLLQAEHAQPVPHISAGFRLRHGPDDQRIPVHEAHAAFTRSYHG